jgi:dihydroflavonol-4-reductase
MVAVTGATGHLGTVLVHRLIADGEEVRYVVRPTSTSRGLDDLPAGTARRVEAELLDVDALSRAFDGAEVVYHAAGMISLMPGDGDALYQVNVEGTRTALEAARRARVRRFVYLGTIEAFPLEGGIFPITEEMTIDPDRTVMDYGRTKALATRLVLDASGAAAPGTELEDSGQNAAGTELDDSGTSAAGTELECVVCAPTAFIGPPDYRLSSLGRFVLDTLRGRLPVAVNGGFDFVDVRDVADGVVRAARHGTPGQVYLLSGEFTTVEDIVAMITSTAGVRGPALTLPLGLVLPFAPAVELYYRATGRTPRFTHASLRLLSLGVRVDSSRARKELGYTARPLAETIADTVRWFLNEGYVAAKAVGIDLKS